VVAERERKRMIATINIVKKDGSETYFDNVANTYVQNGTLLVVEFEQNLIADMPRTVLNVKIPLPDIDSIFTFMPKHEESIAD
jgi:hypothetical protein